MQKKQSVLILGTGISSIMIALRLHQDYDVMIYTKSPDPRKNRDAEMHGSTGNGRMGRFVTGFEGEPYLSNTHMYPNMQWAFQHSISEGGWLSKPLTEFSESEQDWLQKRFDAANDQDAVKKLLEEYYIPNNRWSIEEWKKLSISRPNLFANTNITDFARGVLRLYDNKELLEAVIESHTKYGFLKQVLSTSDIKAKFPVYENACKQGTIAGGIIAEGFSFNILQFVENAITHLEKSGVRFYWNSDIQKIEISNGIVEGLLSSNGELLVTNHYSVNPGAYGNGILNNTPAKDKISGVAGRWIIMPRPIGYDIPTKIHGGQRPGFPVTDNNLTPFVQNGKPMWAVGGGYVYVGNNTENYSNQKSYEIVDSENERTMRIFTSDFYESAKNNNDVLIWQKPCVRSFSYNDAPIHEILPTSHGGSLTITAAGNTGTATIAPDLARWTADVFSKK